MKSLSVKSLREWIEAIPFRTFLFQASKYTFAYGILAAALFVVYLLSCIHTSHKDEIRRKVIPEAYPQLPQDKLRIKGYSQERIKHLWRKVEYYAQGTIYSKVKVYESMKAVNTDWPMIPKVQYFRMATALEQGEYFQVRFVPGKDDVYVTPSFLTRRPEWVSEDVFKKSNEDNVVVLDGVLTSEAEEKLEKARKSVQELLNKNEKFLELSQEHLNKFDKEYAVLLQFNPTKEAQDALGKLSAPPKNMTYYDIVQRERNACWNAIQPNIKELEKLLDTVKNEKRDLEKILNTLGVFQHALPPECHAIIPRSFASKLYYEMQRHSQKVNNRINIIENKRKERFDLAKKLKEGTLRLTKPVSETPQVVKQTESRRMVQVTNGKIQQASSDNSRRTIQPKEQSVTSGTTGNARRVVLPPKQSASSENDRNARRIIRPKTEANASEKADNVRHLVLPKTVQEPQPKAEHQNPPSTERRILRLGGEIEEVKPEVQRRIQ